MESLPPAPKISWEKLKARLEGGLFLSLFSALLAVLMVYILIHYWPNFLSLFYSNKPIFFFFIFLCILSLLIYCLSKLARKAISADKFFASAGILVALFTFLAQNTIDQQRNIDAQEQIRKNTIQSLIVIDKYNCGVAQNMIGNIPQHLTDQLTALSYVIEPYINNFSFISGQFSGKYDQQIAQAIADMQAANTVANLVVDIDVQGATTQLSPYALSIFNGYNNDIVRLSEDMVGNICSNFQTDLQNKL
jgi:hypothetical protein